MSTRATVGLLNKDNTVTAIYSHFNGSLARLGKVLYENYNSVEKVQELLQKGDASFIDTTIEESSFYRDRGENGVDASTYSNVKELEFDSFGNQEFIYLFNQLDGWVVRLPSGDWEKLDIALMK